MAITSTDTAASDERRAQINDLLDQARDLMVEDGMDLNTANAVLHGARPNTRGTHRGEIGDLHRMGQIVNEGIVATPPGVPDIETNDITDAFEKKETPDADGSRLALSNTIDADSPAALAGAESTEDDKLLSVANDEPKYRLPEGSGGGGGGSQTKADLQAELDRRGVEYPASATKADLQALLGE